VDEYGANIHAEDGDGATPLNRAQQNDHTHVVEYLQSRHTVTTPVPAIALTAEPPVPAVALTILEVVRNGNLSQVRHL
jgi:ankyrin repeat protein